MLNFYNFDPVAGIGIDAGPRRCNPLIWTVRLRDMLAPEFYSKLRWSCFACTTSSSWRTTCARPTST